MDLVYDLKGNFLYRSSPMLSEDLPITVTAVVNQSYPEHEMSTSIVLQDWGERIQYEIVLWDQNHELEILIEEDGTIVFESED